ncbi:hypothetical protein [Micromonospora sp. NPDC092111]|uniref:hypothetical protein n=1 Tax=Micromonospora sp. NPDC092111 TaxID=3364289 RepID=UPI0037FB8A29
MTRTALRALVPVTVLVGLAACTTTSSDPEAGSSTASAVPGTTSAAPSATSASSAAPSASSASPTRSTAPATPAATRAACPVSAATLQRVSGLGKTHRIDPDHIKCARQWATAGVIAVDPGQQGDGVLLFVYSSAGWKKVGEGSALECSPYGIPKEIGDQIGCRDHS